MFPFVMNFLLSHTGFRWTIRILAALMGVLGGINLLGIKPRLPVAPVSRPRRVGLDLGFIVSPLFLIVVGPFRLSNPRKSLIGLSI